MSYTTGKTEVLYHTPIALQYKAIGISALRLQSRRNALTHKIPYICKQCSVTVFILPVAEYPSFFEDIPWLLPGQLTNLRGYQLIFSRGPNSSLYYLSHFRNLD